MTKLLVICGPTAVGKTKLALHLAKAFNAELISTDSRQVYKGLDIGTGKEWGDGSVKIWGYDLAGPKEEFSVAQFVDFANKTIEDIQGRGKLPILVGGTGLYIKAVVDGIETASIPKNVELRQSLEKLSTDELYQKLSQLDPSRAASMNLSDRKNPRRLIRAIEIAHQIQNSKIKMQDDEKLKVTKSDYKILFVGLTAPLEELEKRIQDRVNDRLKKGIDQEIKGLLENGVSWGDQSMTSLGYRQWRDYFEGDKTKKDVIKEWIQEELNYAKRQLTWFKKDKRVNWFDITGKDWEKSVEKRVRKWYDKNINGNKN